MKYKSSKSTFSNLLQLLAVSQHLIIAQVDVHGELAVKAGQFVVDLGAKIIHLKPLLELLVLGLLSPFL